MASRALVELIVKVVDDLTCEIIKHRFEDTANESRFVQQIHGEWLDAFDEDDQIFQEFDSPQEDLCVILDASLVGSLEEPLICKSRTWRDNRPCFKDTVYNALKCGLIIMFFGIIIGILGVGTVYVIWQTCRFCMSFPLKSMTLKKKWLCKGTELVAILLIHFWCLINLTFVFGWKAVKKSWACQISTTAFLLDVSYRGVIYFTNIDKTARLLFYLRVPVILLLLTSWFLQSFIFTRSSCHSIKERFFLAGKLTVPPITAMVIIYSSYFGIYPLYDDTKSAWGKFFIATFSPLAGSVAKSFLRIIVQRFYYVNHPGTSFIFLIYPYVVSSLLFRIMQAELKSPAFIALLGIVHGTVEVLERSTIVLRDHLDNQLFEWRLAPIGAFRTPRSERLTADIALMSMIYETSSVVVTNGCIFLYTVIYGRDEVEFSFLYIIAIQIGIEWVFTSVSLAIETRFQNMAIFRIWHKKKWLHIMVAASNMFVAVAFFATRFRYVVNSNMDHLNCSYN